MTHSIMRTNSSFIFNDTCEDSFDLFNDLCRVRTLIMDDDVRKRGDLPACLTVYPIDSWSMLFVVETFEKRSSTMIDLKYRIECRVQNLHLESNDKSKSIISKRESRVRFVSFLYVQYRIAIMMYSSV